MSTSTKDRSFFKEFGDKFANVTGREMGPERLYRYRSADTSYFTAELDKIFENSEIYWPIYRELNDPFDCQPKLEKGVTLRDFKLKIMPVLTLLRAQVSKEILSWRASDVQLRRMVKEELSKIGNKEIKHWYEDRFASMISMTVNGVAVLSLCEDFNNPVMWSMYGSRGNGVCFGFRNVPVSMKFGETESWWVGKLQVEYADNRPTYDYWGAVASYLHMTPDTCNLIPKRYEKYLLKGIEQQCYLWTKHTRWSYEQEYRSVLQLGYPPSDDHLSGKYRVLDGLELASVRLGPLVSSEHVERILGLARRHAKQVRVYRSKISAVDYGLEFEEITE